MNIGPGVYSSLLDIANKHDTKITYNNVLKSITHTRLTAAADAINYCLLKEGGLTPGLQQSAIAALAIEFLTRLTSLDLPESVLTNIPSCYDRLVKYLLETLEKGHDYEEDYFLKDANFVMGLSVPCGAQIVDLKSKLGWGYVAHNIKNFNLLCAAESAMDMLFNDAWFRVHTESRYLTEFNPEGWNDCYHRIVDLLHKNPGIKGVTGTSWFYDPQLKTISGRLKYLLDTPLKNGAVCYRNGTGDIHTQRATATSNTRLKLYKQGVYMPTCYSIVWPRDKIIAWANKTVNR